MTADERAHIRALIQQARLERVAREERVEAEERTCAHCGAPIPPERVGRGKFRAIYCKPTHRQYAYYRRKRAVAA